MRKLFPLFLVFLLLFLTACQPTSMPDNSAPSETTAPTQPTETSPTEPEIRNARKVFVYSSDIPEHTWKSEGIDVTQCKEGFLYSFDPVTGQLIELYDASLLESYHYASWAAGNQTANGEYIYYITKAQPETIYRMDYLGNVVDQLVYEAPSGSRIRTLRVLSGTYDLQQIAVQLDKQIVVVDLLKGTSDMVHEEPDMDQLSDFSYDLKTGYVFVLYSLTAGENDPPADYKEYYNITTGEVSLTYPK